MAFSAFGDKAVPPTERTLQLMLGRAAAPWDRLIARLDEAHGPLIQEWNYAGAAYGWSFRLKKAARTIVYMTPCEKHFLASFALGEKACAAARAGGLPAS